MSDESEGSTQAPESTENGGADKGKPAASSTEKPAGDKASNPLGEEQRGFNDAFWQGQRFLSPDKSRAGPSATIGRADIRDMQIGDRTQIFIGHTVSRLLARFGTTSWSGCGVAMSMCPNTRA